jgi:hypothetical protein
VTAIDLIPVNLIKHCKKMLAEGIGWFAAKKEPQRHPTVMR